MKIQLERRSASCPDILRCTVCHQTFFPSRIRTLLYSDRGLLQGDVCPACMKLDKPTFKRTLWEQSRSIRPAAQDVIFKPVQELFQSGQDQSSQDQKSNQDNPIVKLRERAYELAELTQEDLKMPTWWHWVLKEIQIFMEEYHELKVASQSRSSIEEVRSHLEKIYQDLDL
jgi:hypothetical protein